MQMCMYILYCFLGEPNFFAFVYSIVHTYTTTTLFEKNLVRSPSHAAGTGQAKTFVVV